MVLGEYVVEFQHDVKRGTRCVIKDPRTKEVIKTGWARKHTHDKFCKAIGRKIAMTRAIKDFHRSIRTDMWNDFLEKLKI